MPLTIPVSWKTILQKATSTESFRNLESFIDEERRTQQVFPEQGNVFSAFDLTPYDEVRVVILGQDPYHDDGQAHGLSFSVKPGVRIPPSLRNIFKELNADLGCRIPEVGCLEPWAAQGVLMLNTVLTVRAHEANSHRKRGWEEFTDAVIRKLNEKQSPLVFLLWGNPAQKKRELIDQDRHSIIASAHPSPLSASRGFFGSKPFSRVNAILRQHGEQGIDWQLPVGLPEQPELF